MPGDSHCTTQVTILKESPIGAIDLVEGQTVGILNLYSTFTSQMRQVLGERLREYHRRSIFPSALGCSSSVPNLKNWPFRASMKRSEIFHIVVREGKAKWEVTRKRFAGQSERAVAYQEVSFLEHDRTWPWWCFWSVPEPDEGSGTSSILAKPSSRTLFSERTAVMLAGYEQSECLKGGPLPSPPPWKKKWNQSFMPKHVCLVPGLVDMWAGERQEWNMNFKKEGESTLQRIQNKHFSTP